MQGAHTIEELAMGPAGPIDFSMHNWAGGMQSSDQGLEYRTVEDTQSGYFDETRAYRRATLHSYISAAGVDAAFPGQVIMQPAAASVGVASGGNALGGIIKQIDFTASGGSPKSYLIESQRYQHKLTSAGWQQYLDIGTGNVPKDIIVHGGKLIIGVGSGGQYYSADGVTFTVATANKADAYGTLGSNLYRAVRPNTVFAATAVDGTWDSGSTIADSTYNINSLTGVEQILMIGKEDGVYSIDAEGLVVPFTPELRTQTNTNFASVKATDTFNGDYYFRTRYGLIEISGGDGQKARVGLDQLAIPDLPTTIVESLTHDDKWLYAIVDVNQASAMTGDIQNSATWILRRSILGAWHPYYYFAGSPAQFSTHHVYVSALDNIGGTNSNRQYLWYSYWDSTNYVTKAIALAKFPNPVSEQITTTPYQYDTTQAGLFRVGRFGSAESQMVIDQVMVQSRDLAAGRTITLYMAADGGSILPFGSAVTTSPSVSVIPTTPVTANYVDLYFELATNSSYISPMLVGFSMKGTYRPNYRRVHTFSFNTKRAHQGIRAGERKKAPTESTADLLTLLGTNSFQTVRDERGASFLGLLQGIKRTVMSPRPGTEPEEVVQVVVQQTAGAPVLA